MKYTEKQKSLFRTIRPTKVFVDTFKSEAELAYARKGDEVYEVHINDKSEVAKNNDARRIAIVHEFGHIALGHCDYTIRELEEIVKSHAPKEYKSVLGEFTAMELCNYAMDFEVNAKYVSFSNYKVMRDAGFPILDYRSRGMSYHDDWIGYLDEMLNNQDLGCLPIIPMDLGEMPAFSDSRQLGEGESLEGEDTDDSPGDYHSLHSENLTDSDGGKVSKIIKFLKEVYMDHKRVMRIDSMKSYNRGTRGRGKIVYTSHSKKIRNQNPRLLIVIDVSGSMVIEDVTNAIRAVRDISNEMNYETEIVHWDTRLVKRYSINEIPEEKADFGGGTDIYKALEYAREGGFDKVVFYSDFYTDGELPKLKGGLWVGTIIVDSNKKFIEGSDKNLKIN